MRWTVMEILNIIQLTRVEELDDNDSRKEKYDVKMYK